MENFDKNHKSCRWNFYQLSFLQPISGSTPTRRQEHPGQCVGTSVGNESFPKWFHSDPFLWGGALFIQCREDRGSIQNDAGIRGRRIQEPVGEGHFQGAHNDGLSFRRGWGHGRVPARVETSRDFCNGSRSGDHLHRGRAGKRHSDCNLFAAPRNAQYSQYVSVWILILKFGASWLDPWGCSDIRGG